MNKPTEAMLSVMRQRAILLSQLRSDRASLKIAFDYERERLDKHIEYNVRALEQLPTIEVIVEVVLYLDDMATESVGIVTTNDRFIETAVARACALNPHFAREVQDGNGEIYAFVKDTIIVRPEAEMIRAASGGAQ